MTPPKPPMRWDAAIRPGSLAVSPAMIADAVSSLHDITGGEAGKGLTLCLGIAAAIASQIIGLDEETFLGACQDAFQHAPGLFIEIEEETKQ